MVIHNKNLRIYCLGYENIMDILVGNIKMITELPNESVIQSIILKPEYQSIYIYISHPSFEYVYEGNEITKYNIEFNNIKG